jgi:hypothetical protein
MLLLPAAPALAAPACGDVNDNGKVTSSDALAVLRSAVGQPVDLVCAPPAGPLQTGEINDFGSGSDGTVRAGVPHSFVDNGNGTITDLATGLTWEKKDNSGGIHDKDDTYSWSTGGFVMNGSIATAFLATLNGGSGFAGHSDWRIPNRFELETLVDADTQGPATWPEFDTSCPAACTVTTCSCTRSAGTYWSSTTYVSNPSGAWAVNFNDADVTVPVKSELRYVRAVRGGN